MNEMDNNSLKDFILDLSLGYISFKSEKHKLEFLLNNFVIFLINDLLFHQLLDSYDDLYHELLKKQYDLQLKVKLKPFYLCKERIEDKKYLKIVEKQFEKDSFVMKYLTNINDFYEKYLLGDDRKNYGLFSTPKFVVKYILDQIFPTEFGDELRILDNSCGTGIFLIEAVNRLKNIFQTNKIVCDDFKIQLTGIDINPIMLQILLLNFIYQKFGSIDVSLKIYCYDALLFNKYQNKFDLILGNPPYFIIAKTQKNNQYSNLKRSHKTYISPEILEKYKKYYSSDAKQINIFNLFIEHGINHLRENGYLGFIIPDIFLAGNTSQKIREYILNTCSIQQISKISDQVFEDGGINNIILILKREKNQNKRNNNMIKIKNMLINEIKNKKSSEINYIKQEIFVNLPYNNFSINIDQNSWNEIGFIFHKIANKQVLPLQKLVNIQRGIEIGKKNSRIITAEKAHLLNSNNSNLEIGKIIATENVCPFRIDYKNKNFNNMYVIFDPYNKGIFKDEKIYKSPKILLKRISDKLIAAIDMNGEYYCLDSIQILNLKPNIKYDLFYLLGVLNSEFLNKYYHLIFGGYKKLFARVNKSYLKNLPIPKVSLENQLQVANIVRKLIEIENNYTAQFLEMKTKVDKIIYSHYLYSK
ncbi:MAG: N-6 DNA methylase [Candidatus Helarchaeota archaeon]